MGEEILGTAFANSVDFQFKGWNFNIFYGVVRWRPGTTGPFIMSAAWDDTWVRERYDEYMSLELQALRKSRGWFRRRFRPDTFTEQDILGCAERAVQRIRDLVNREAQSLPNLDKIPGRVLNIE